LHNRIEFIEFANKNFLKIPLKKLSSETEGVEISMTDFISIYEEIFYNRDFEKHLYSGEDFKKALHGYITELYKS